MSHVCPGANPLLMDDDGHWLATAFCPTAGRCPDDGYLVCAAHGCQMCGNRRDKTPTEAARAEHDARVLGSGAGYIGRHRA